MYLLGVKRKELLSSTDQLSKVLALMILSIATLWGPFSPIGFRIGLHQCQKQANPLCSNWLCCEVSSPLIALIPQYPYRGPGLQTKSKEIESYCIYLLLPTIVQVVPSCADSITTHSSHKISLRGSPVPEHITSREERKVERALMPDDFPGEKRCLGTVLNPELERIRTKHTILASTGCTRDFCQSGRMMHTDEPRGT